MIGIRLGRELVKFDAEDESSRRIILRWLEIAGSEQANRSPMFLDHICQLSIV